MRWLYDGLIGGLARLSGLVLLLIAAMIVVDVVVRNLDHQPPQGISALTEYALLYVTMASAPWLVRTGGHVTIQTVCGSLPLGLRVPLRRAVVVLSAALSLLLAAAAAGMAIESFGRGDVDIRSIDLPRWLLFLPLAVGFMLIAAEFARLLILGDGESAEQEDLADSAEGF